MIWRTSLIHVYNKFCFFLISYLFYGLQRTLGVDKKKFKRREKIIYIC